MIISMSQNINEIEEVSVRRLLQSFFIVFYLLLIKRLKPIKPLLGLNYSKV